MTRTIIAIAIAFLAVTTLLDSASQACISCEYVPPVVHSGERTHRASPNSGRNRQPYAHRKTRKYNRNADKSDKHRHKSTAKSAPVKIEPQQARTEPRRENTEPRYERTEPQQARIEPRRENTEPELEATLPQQTPEAKPKRVETALPIEPNRNREDSYDDCGQYKNLDVQIRGCSELIARGEKETSQTRVWAYISRGVAYRNRGDYDRAIVDYTGAIELDPAYADAYYVRGVASFLSGDYERAIADFSQTIILNPKDAFAHYNRGVAFENTGKRQQAIADYRKTLEINPTDEDASKALASLGVTPSSPTASSDPAADAINEQNGVTYTRGIGPNDSQR